MRLADPLSCWNRPPIIVSPGTSVTPANAIVQRGGKNVAFVVEGDKAMQRELKLGRTLGDDREVLSGLNGGDAVVLDPPEQMADGARVKLATDEDAQK